MLERSILGDREVANVTIVVTMADGSQVRVSKDDPFKFTWGLTTQPDEVDLPLRPRTVLSGAERVTGFTLGFEPRLDDYPFVTFDVMPPGTVSGR